MAKLDNPNIEMLEKIKKAAAAEAVRKVLKLAKEQERAGEPVDWEANCNRVIQENRI